MKLLQVSIVALIFTGLASCGDKEASKDEKKEGGKEETAKANIDWCECVEIGAQIQTKYAELGATDEFSEFEKSFADKLRACETKKGEIGMENLAKATADCQ